MKGQIKVIKPFKFDPNVGRKVGGYGFLTDESGADRFFHANEVKGTTFDSLREGLHVTFEPIEIQGKGLRAANVQVIKQ